MGKVNVTKRGNLYQYRFEIAPQGGVRKFINKSGFKTKQDAYVAGMKAFNEYMNTGKKFSPNTCSYSDFLDYWMANYCQINLRYNTIEAYKSIIKNHVKPKLGFYRLSQIDTATLNDFLTDVFLNKGVSKNFLKSIMKVLKSSFAYAEDGVGFIKHNPALKIRLPRYDGHDEDPAHIFTPEEIEMIFNRFKNSHCIYYAFLTAYYTGLRVSEVFGLTWEDIDFDHCTVHVDKSLLIVNKGYHLTTTKEDNVRDIDVAPEFMEYLKTYREQWLAQKHRMGSTWQTCMDGKWESYRESLQKLRGKNFIVINDFGWPISPDHYGKIVDRVAEKAGIRKIHPHMFRHTFVSILLSNPDIGVATVAAEAGHAQPSTTLAIYTQVYHKRQDSIRSQMSETLYKRKTPER